MPRSVLVRVCPDISPQALWVLCIETLGPLRLEGPCSTSQSKATFSFHDVSVCFWACLGVLPSTECVIVCFKCELGLFNVFVYLSLTAIDASVHADGMAHFERSDRGGRPAQWRRRQQRWSGMDHAHNDNRWMPQNTHFLIKRNIILQNVGQELIGLCIVGVTYQNEEQVFHLSDCYTNICFIKVLLLSIII